MNRLKIFNQIEDLLTVCRMCPKNLSTITAQEKCVGCSTYSELRDAGNQLDQLRNLKRPNVEKKNRMRKRITITPEMYLALKKEGLTDKEIGQRFDVSKTTIHNYKVRWKKSRRI